MKLRTIIYLVMIWALLPAMVLNANDSQQKEYQIKTALIYNFLKFIEWPEETFTDEAESGKTSYLTIGLLSDKELYKICKSIEGKKVKNQTIRIQRVFAEDLEAGKPALYKSIDVLYLTRPRATEDWVNLKKVMNGMEDRSILTISETKDFINVGGMINFMLDGNHVNFEINLDAAKQSGLEIKTSLLKLAKKVVQKSKE